MFHRSAFKPIVHLSLLVLACESLCAEVIGQGTELSNFLGVKSSEFSVVASKTGPGDFDAACFLDTGHGLEPDRILVLRKVANTKPSQNSLSVYGTVDLLDCIVRENNVDILAMVRIGRNGEQQQVRLITLNGDQKTERIVNVTGSNFSSSAESVGRNCQERKDSI